MPAETPRQQADNCDLHRRNPACQSPPPAPLPKAEGQFSQPALSRPFPAGAAVDGILAVAMGRLKHGHDVGRGDVGLDVVDGVEDKAAPGRQVARCGGGLPPAPRRAGQVQAPAACRSRRPRTIGSAKLLLQLGRVHARGRHLHGIEDVNADLDQVGQKLPHRAATVVEDLGLGAGLDRRDDPAQRGLIIRR